MKSLNLTIELLPDNSLVLLNTLNLITVHDRTGLEAKPFEAFRIVAKPKITVTNSGIYMTDLSKHPDFRAEAIVKRFFDLGKVNASRGATNTLKDLSSSETINMLTSERIRNIENEITLENCKEKPNPKIIAFLKKQLSITPTIFVSNETKSIFDKVINDTAPVLKEIETPLPSYSAVSEEDRVSKKKDVTRTSKSYDSLLSEKADKNIEFTDEMYKIGVNPAQVETYMRMQSRGESIPPKVADLIAKMKAFNKDFESSVNTLASDKGITAQTSSAKVNAQATLNKSLLKFTRIEKGPEINMAVAPKGKEFLFIYFDSTNNSTSQQFFSPDAEFRLIYNNEVIPLRNYRMETNKDPGKLYSNEQLFFVIPEDVKEFTLEIGKKALGVQKINLKL